MTIETQIALTAIVLGIVAAALCALGHLILGAVTFACAALNYVNAFRIFVRNIGNEASED